MQTANALQSLEHHLDLVLSKTDQHWASAIFLADPLSTEIMGFRTVGFRGLGLMGFTA